MAHIDWNRNGKRDHFDKFMDYKVMQSLKDSEQNTAPKNESDNFRPVTNYDSEFVKEKFIKALTWGLIIISIIIGLLGLRP